MSEAAHIDPTRTSTGLDSRKLGAIFLVTECRHALSSLIGAFGR